MANLIDGRTGDWEIVIGLEIHAQIVNHRSVFARKNYFYPDLPQGYQISQFELPVVGEGVVEVDLADNETGKIGIERLHMEQDAGKSLHDQHPSKSYIDLNRSGVALMEIVSKPDMRFAEEAAAYVSKVRSILRYVGSCDGNMQEGSLRVDANVSVRHPGEPLGTRCEIKNINSLRFLRQAIDYEARRQVELIEDGGEVAMETRLFDSSEGTTRTMRSKEEAHDYRYFPDPDLLPLEFTEEYAAKLKDTLPELPDAKKVRFMADYGLSAYDAGVLVAERTTADYFEAVAKGRDAKQTANRVVSELFGRLNKGGIELSESPVSAAALGGLIDLISDNTISGRIAKEVFDEMFETGKAAAEIVEEKGLQQVTDSGAIEGVVDQIIADNAGQVENYRAGNEKVIGWFVGQVMKATEGKANPQMVNQVLREKLKA